MAQKIVGAMLALGLMLWAAAAQAQNYAPLEDDTDRTQELIDELRGLIDAAERSRAADRRFLRDLRAALSRFDYPWRVRLITEDFRDGDYTDNPAWIVESGEFFMARRGGLHSEAVVPSLSRRGSRDNGSSSQDLVVGILTEILRSRTDSGSGNAEPAPRRDRIAAIYLPARITNAFALSAEIAAPDPAGALEFVVYQGADREVGYRLSFLPGGGVELLRDGRRSSAVIEFRDDTPVLGGGVTRVVEWTRATDGHTVVRLDGTVLFETVDRSFRDPFDGFELVNRGGEYVLRALTIDGTN